MPVHPAKPGRGQSRVRDSPSLPLVETMMAMKFPRVMALSCLVVLLAACTGAARVVPPTTQRGTTPPTTGAAPRTGTLTGIVWACQGMVASTTGHVPPPLVPLYVSHRGRVIAKQAVRSGHHYRMELPPGVYTVSSPPKGLGRSDTVTVVAGGMVEASMVNFCK